MLQLQNFPFTFFPDFAIKFDWETFTTGGSADAIINEAPGANALSGSDFIIGSLSANVKTTDEVILAGIRHNAAFDADRGNDWMIGKVSIDAEDGANINARGITTLRAPGVTIQMGDGRDRLIGEVKATVGDNVTFARESAGLSVIASTGDGNDFVKGKLKISAGDGLTAKIAAGISSGIDTGAGRDKIIGTVDVKAGAGSSLDDVFGIGRNAFTGDGDDTVKGTVKATLGDNSTVIFNNGLSVAPLETGAGDDKVIGTVIAAVGENSGVGLSSGIAAGVIDTGDGDDKVIGKVSATGEAGSNIGGNNGFGQGTIITGAGDDLVEGSSSIAGTGLNVAFGDGIGGLVIDTGDDNDKVIGKGADMALGGTSDGLDGTDVFLGAGDDEVYARGASSGVRNVEIFGEEGDDVFDLHSGTGEVDGGDDMDLLILSGDKDDFTFTAGAPEAGNISGGVTDLDVANIELFEFDNGTFTYDQLFA